MDRVLVAGSSGAGKTTMARHIGRCMVVPCHELDALQHGPGWMPRPSFEADVVAFAATDHWVTEDQYVRFLGELLWERADTVVWLDLPLRVIMRRVLWRSVTRAAFRSDLWNGNIERWQAWADHDHPIRWAWSQHLVTRGDVLNRCKRHPHVTVVRLRTARAARRWRRELRRTTRHG